MPGTPLYQTMSEQKRLLSGVDYADVHGQFNFNFRDSTAISRDDSKRILDWASPDFELNGPSLYRMSRTLLAGWRRYKDSPDERVGTVLARDGPFCSEWSLWVGALGHGAALRKVNGEVSGKIRKLRQELPQIGICIADDPGDPWSHLSMDNQAENSWRGKTYEPPTIVERSNWSAA